MKPAYLEPVTDAESAMAFLRALHVNGLLYHPEEDAAGCLTLHDLPLETVSAIEANMTQTWQFLLDPCETALRIANAEGDDK